MRAAWITALFAAFTIGRIAAQGLNENEAVTAACLNLSQTLLSQVANGKLAEAELTVSALLASGDGQTQDLCGGLALTHIAVTIAVYGRLADAERLAERALLILEKSYSSTDPVLLRPLQLLAATRFGQGKTAKAGEAFKRMQAIRIQRPEDDALVHAIGALLFDREGKLPQAEAEYLAAIRLWDEVGRSESADVGVALTSLGWLYIRAQRLTDARQALDRAGVIFDHSTDAVALDRVKLLNVRGVLHARQDEWIEAEQTLRSALSMADSEPWVEPAAVRAILTNYAHVLRKNHHGREARTIEVRAAAIPVDHTSAVIVDITELLPKAKPAKE
jgi:hypothetical protein